MCAVDQKRPFFPRAGPFLDLLPFKGPFSLYRGPYGKPLTSRGPVRVLHREGRRRGLREGRALTGSPLRGGTVLTNGRAGVPYGSFTEKDDEEAYGKAGPLRETPRSALTGRPTYEKASYGEASYRKAPYGEASYEKAPYELQESLRLYQNWAGISACVP